MELSLKGLAFSVNQGNKEKSAKALPSAHSLISHTSRTRVESGMKKDKHKEDKQGKQLSLVYATLEFRIAIV